MELQTKNTIILTCTFTRVLNITRDLHLALFYYLVPFCLNLKNSLGHS